MRIGDAGEFLNRPHHIRIAKVNPNLVSMRLSDLIEIHSKLTASRAKIHEGIAARLLIRSDRQKTRIDVIDFDVAIRLLNTHCDTPIVNKYFVTKSMACRCRFAGTHSGDCLHRLPNPNLHTKSEPLLPWCLAANSMWSYSRSVLRIAISNSSQCWHRSLMSSLNPSNCRPAWV